MEDDRPAAERAELVRQAQAGDRRAFAHLAQRHGRAVYAIALAHLGRAADAEDVAQASLLAALEHLDDCRDPARFDAWLFAIARNRARRALLRRRLRDVLPRITPEPPDPAGAPLPEARMQLLRALAGLPARAREVVLLHDLERYSHAEIAAALGVSEESSRQHLSRARRALRAHLEEKPP